MKLLNTIVVFFLVFTIKTVYAQESSSTTQSKDIATFAIEISFDYDSGIPAKLSFDVKSSRKKVWLGVSLYPKTTNDYLREGEHQQIELNGETMDKVVKAGKKFAGGTFEAALWGKKVPSSECTIEDCYWCSKNGFHLDELLAYKAGTFVYTR
ncbi:MAG: hypothetical protein EPO24_00275 [Bacteroidetes bacterium]|nr:MAG: hypothetical protein EPO24_00275 [Bacteroidota bacterium]